MHWFPTIPCTGVINELTLTEQIKNLIDSHDESLFRHEKHMINWCHLSLFSYSTCLCFNVMVICRIIMPTYHPYQPSRCPNIQENVTFSCQWLVFHAFNVEHASIWNCIVLLSLLGEVDTDSTTDVWAFASSLLSGKISETVYPLPVRHLNYFWYYFSIILFCSWLTRQTIDMV